MSLLNLSFYLFAINSVCIQCINPVAHLVKYDEVKKRNFTELESKAHLVSSYFTYCRPFELNFDPPIFVDEVNLYGRNGFNTNTNIHEVALNVCKRPASKISIGPDGDTCQDFGYNMPEDIALCLRLYVVVMAQAMESNWKLGSDQALKFGNEATRYFMMIVHFHLHDTHHVNTTIDFGLRLWHTTKPNLNPVGIVPVGPPMSITGVIVPPKSPKFITAGHCSSECFREKRSEGIHIIGLLPHYHKHGLAQIVRHFRSGKELAPLFNGSVDWKNVAPVWFEPVEFMLGDQLIVECIYNTMDENTTVTQTGVTAPKEEMCFAMMYQYPFIDDGVLWCGSVMSEQTITKATGKDIVLEDYWKTPFPKIASPPELKGMPITQIFDKMTKEDFQNDIQDLLRYSPQWAHCSDLFGWPPKKNISLVYPVRDTNEAKNQDCQLI